MCGSVIGDLLSTLNGYGMTHLLSLKNVQQIKNTLGRKLPSVKSSHRVEAMARGLGWKSNAALRACLLCGPTECELDEAAFKAYLTERGFGPITEGLLGKTVAAATAKTRPVLTAPKPQQPPQLDRAVRALVSMVAGKIALVAAFAGVLAAALYLYVGAFAAANRLDASMEQLLTAAEGPAMFSSLILSRELADEVTKSFTAFPYVKSVSIYDDHGSLLSQNVRQNGNDVRSFAVTSLFSKGGEKVYSRTLHLPETLAEAPARFQLTIDRNRGLASVAGPSLSGLILFFLLGGGSVFALVGVSSVLKRRLHGYLVSQYRMQTA
jgi:hypothetical protein